MTDANNAAASPREEIPPLGPNESRLYVNNLPWSLTNDDLSKWIKSEIGVVALDVSIVQNKKFERSRGYAFIKINKNDLQKCLTLNGKNINDREIGVQEAQQRSEEERTAHRAQQAAKRAEKRQQRDTAKSSEQPSTSAAAPAAAQPKKEKTERAPRPKTSIKQFDNATTIHITNLAFKVDQASLTAFIQQSIGVAPLDVTIPVRRGKYKTGQSLGYGFVVVPNDKADAAVALNGQTFEDRPLKVNLARPQSENEEQTSGGDAPARQQRPPRRNARRGRGGRAAGNGESNGAAAAASPSAASPSAAAPESSGSAAPAKRGRGRGGRRPPRAGAEDGDAQ